MLIQWQGPFTPRAWAGPWDDVAPGTLGPPVVGVGVPIVLPPGALPTQLDPWAILTLGAPAPRVTLDARGLVLLRSGAGVALVGPQGVVVTADRPVSASAEEGIVVAVNRRVST